ncbi:MAG: hypothetical protein H7234_04530 [Herminiimonas sp.]|nr:hypothetical protein [Herminiimonas sp.]
MRTFLIAPVLAAALFATAGAANAADHGNHGGTGSGTHSVAATNSNGIRSLDRDRGLERAAERRNSRSLTDKRSKKIHVKK